MAHSICLFYSFEQKPMLLHKHYSNQRNWQGMWNLFSIVLLQNHCLCYFFWCTFYQRECFLCYEILQLSNKLISALMWNRCNPILHISKINTLFIVSNNCWETVSIIWKLNNPINLEIYNTMKILHYDMKHTNLSKY